jgi:hypothetical protein
MKLKPLGTAGTGSVWDDFFLNFFSQSKATKLGPAADSWTCVCKLLYMNLKPLGTAGTGSAWDAFFF